jgi:hypothetical protein
MSVFACYNRWKGGFERQRQRATALFRVEELMCLEEEIQVCK